MLVTKLGIFLDCLRDDFFELRWQVRIHARCRRRFTLENRIENYARGVSGESLAPSGHFVQYQAERKQVRAPIQFFAAHLFGRHVRHRPERGAWAGEIRVRFHRLAADADSFLSVRWN